MTKKKLITDIQQSIKTPLRKHNSKNCFFYSTSQIEKWSVTSHFSRLVIWPQNYLLLLISHNTTGIFLYFGRTHKNLLR